MSRGIMQALPLHVHCSGISSGTQLPPPLVQEVTNPTYHLVNGEALHATQRILLKSGWRSCQVQALYASRRWIDTT